MSAAPVTSIALLSLLVGCSSSTPLGTCPGGTPTSHCVARAIAWDAVAAEASTDAGHPQGCPSSEQLGPEGLAKLGFSGYRFEGEPTWDSATDRCCYKTVSGSC